MLRLAVVLNNPEGYVLVVEFPPVMVILLEAKVDKRLVAKETLNFSKVRAWLKLKLTDAVCVVFREAVSKS